MKPFYTFIKKLKASPFFTDIRYERYRMLLVPFLVLVVAILVSVLVTVPQIYKLLNTYKTLGELQQKKLFYQKKAADLGVVKIQEFREDLDTSLVALPVEKDIPGVMGEILVSLSGSGMDLNGIAFSSSPPESEKVEEYQVTIEASGTEANLRSFLERITLAPRLIKLTSIQIGSSSKGNLNVSIALATFYQTLPTNIGKIDDPLPKINKDDIQVLADIKTKTRQFPKVSTQTSQTTTPTGKTNPFSP